MRNSGEGFLGKGTLVSLNLKLKQLHFNPLYDSDSRLKLIDKAILSSLLKLTNKDGSCITTKGLLAESTNSHIQTINRRLTQLGLFGYLKWERFIPDSRKTKFFLQIPYKENEWALSLKFKSKKSKTGFENENELSSFLNRLFEGTPEELEWKDHIKIGNDILSGKLMVSPRSIMGCKYTGFCLLLYLSKNKNLKSNILVNKMGCKSTPFPVDKKPKNKQEDPELSNPSSPYFEDNPPETEFLIRTYTSWRLRRTGSNGSGWTINSTSRYYKNFVLLRKQLMSFRGKRNYPSVQKLFWDYFSFLGTHCDESGKQLPYLNGMIGEWAWETYVAFIDNQFPDGTYWMGDTFSIEQFNEEQVSIH